MGLRVSISAGAGRPRRHALTVYWRGEETDGVLLYGLRDPGTERLPFSRCSWGPGTAASDPWLLHGPGWKVDVWTIRPEPWPSRDRWKATLRASLDRLLQAGYAVAWFATEGDFVDPPGLLDPSVMGDGVYAAASRPTGFLMRDDGGPELEPLSGRDLAALHKAAAATWSSA